MAGYDEIPFDQGSGGSPQIGINMDSGSSGGGNSWGGFGKLGMDLLGSVGPGLLGSAAGYGFGALMPGKTTLTDTRNPQQRGAAAMNMDRLSALQANPTSFGLPGDPNDPNSPAGKKRYDITQASRNADAARGMFTTGGSAQRETNAMNTAVGNEYNNIWNQSSQQASAGPGMNMQTQENPWAKLFSGMIGPAVSGTAAGVLRNFGIQSRNPLQFGG